MTLYVYWGKKGDPAGLQRPAEVVVDEFHFLP
jgi:hypothetical protein